MKKTVNSKDVNMNENIPINEEVEQFETSILKIRLPRLENIAALSNFEKNNSSRITELLALDTQKQRIHESPQPTIENDKGSFTSNENAASDNTSDNVHRRCVKDVLFHVIMNTFPDENETSVHRASEKQAVVQVSDQEGDVAGTTVDNYLTKWPSQDRTEAFFIRVYIVNTIPVIREKSSVFDIMSLIKCYCASCSKLLPFYSCDWKQSEISKGKVPVCPECTSQEDMVKQLDFLIACELSLEDEEGTPVAAIVSGEHAEKFFGCTVDELCLSEETKIRIRKFIHTHIEKRNSIVLKIILQKCPVSNRLRYVVLS